MLYRRPTESSKEGRCISVPKFSLLLGFLRSLVRAADLLVLRAGSESEAKIFLTSLLVVHHPVPLCLKH